jgi:hypothetical protein
MKISRIRVPFKRLLLFCFLLENFLNHCVNDQGRAFTSAARRILSFFSAAFIISWCHRRVRKRPSTQPQFIAKLFD